MNRASSTVNPVRIATVVSHRRPTEVAPAIDMLVELAREAGAVLRFDPDETRKHELEPGECMELDAPISKDVDICFALGGDGTILTALRTYAGTGVPVFGVNYGEIGFLATVDRDYAPTGYRRAFAGDFEVLSLPGISLAGERGRVARDQRRLDAPPAGQARRRPRVCGRRGRDRARPMRRTRRRDPRRLDRLQPRQRRAGDGLGRGGPRGLVHRAAFADRPGAGRRPQDVLSVHNRSREEPVDVTVDGRPVCVLAPAEQIAARFADAQGALAQMPGATSTSACATSSAGWRPRRSGGGPSGAPGTPSRMLHELRVENLLLMERAELRLAPG